MELFDKDNNPIEEVYDSEGKEIEEVVTGAEAKQQVEDAKEEAKADYEADTTALKEELDENKETLKIAQEDLEKEQEKDKNFGKLRGAALEKEKEVQAQKEKVEALEKKFEGLEATTKTQPINTMIKKLSGEDEELEKKIKFHYDSFTVPVEDTEELQKERIKNAVILAGGGETANPLTGGVVSSAEGVAPGGEMPIEGKLSDPAAEGIAHKMGISDQELKKAKLK